MPCYADWMIFSDLDGPLLDHDTHCMGAARPQVERLAHLHIPLIVASSKTLAEVRALALPGPPQPPILESGALLAVPERGLRLDEGGRFLHILGVGADKGRAMRGLLGLYRLHDRPVRATMALGDSPNDLGMLHNADRPVVVRHPDGSWLDAASVPRAVYTRGIGPHGWHEAVGQLLGEMGKRMEAVGRQDAAGAGLSCMLERCS